MTTIDWVIIGILLSLIVMLLWTWAAMSSEPARRQATDIDYTIGQDAMVQSYDPTGKLVVILRYRKNEHWRVPHLGDYLFLQWHAPANAYRYLVVARQTLEPGRMAVTCKLVQEK